MSFIDKNGEYYNRTMLIEVVKISIEEKLLDNGYEGVIYFTNFSYDTALVGVTEDNRAVYDFDLMVEWLMKNTDFTYEEATEWIEYNTLRSLHYIGDGAPIVFYRLAE